MREYQQCVARLQMMRKKYILNIAWLTLQPEELACTARTNNIEPHQARVHDRMKADIRPIARENILHRKHRMSRSKYMYSPARQNGGRKGTCSRLDVLIWVV